MNSSLAFAIYICLLGSLAIGVVYRPAVALAAVSCIFGLKQWGQSMNSWLATNALFTNEAIGVLVLLAIAVSAARGRCVFCKMPRVTYLIILLLFYSWVSLQWVRRPDLAEPIWNPQYPYLIMFIVLVPLVIQGTDDLRVALRWLLFVGGALVVLLLAFGNWGVRGLFVGYAEWDTETNPLALAGLGGALVAVALFIGARKSSLIDWLLRLALLGAGLLLILRSGSRGQLIASIIASLAMLPVAFKFTSIRGFGAATVAAIVIGVSIVYGFTSVEGDQRWTQANGVKDAAGRLDNIKALLSVWDKNAATTIFGLGNSAAWDPSIVGIYPHNVPAEVLGEEGIVGFLLYAAILFVSARSFVRASRLARNDEENRGLVAATGAAFLFFFILTLKQGNMIGSVEFFMYAIVLGRLERALEAHNALADPAETIAQVPGIAFPNLLR